MKKPGEIFADFNNADAKGRVRLSTFGSTEDITKLNIKMQQGMEVWLNDNEGLKVRGIIEFSDEENIWVAAIDWNELM